MKSPHSLNILIIEDNLINQRLASSLLERSGHQVTLAGDGVEGLKLFEIDKFDVILMDIQMPYMSGLEASREIRKLESAKGCLKPVKIIAVTTFNGPQDIHNCMEAGMDDHLSKPYAPEAILNKINDQISLTC